jgi:hypothetical protein
MGETPAHAADRAARGGVTKLDQMPAALVCIQEVARNGILFFKGPTPVLVALQRGNDTQQAVVAFEQFSFLALRPHDPPPASPPRRSHTTQRLTRHVGDTQAPLDGTTAFVVYSSARGFVHLAVHLSCCLHFSATVEAEDHCLVTACGSTWLSHTSRSRQRRWATSIAVTARARTAVGKRWCVSGLHGSAAATTSWPTELPGAHARTDRDRESGVGPPSPTVA